jgi:hypothetical protein
VSPFESNNAADCQYVAMRRKGRKSSVTSMQNNSREPHLRSVVIRQRLRPVAVHQIPRPQRQERVQDGPGPSQKQFLLIKNHNSTCFLSLMVLTTIYIDVKKQTRVEYPILFIRS